MACLLQEHRAEVERLDQVNKEKAKENKRLKDSFDTLKVANDTLRKEVRAVLGIFTCFTYYVTNITITTEI